MWGFPRFSFSWLNTPLLNQRVSSKYYFRGRRNFEAHIQSNHLSLIMSMFLTFIDRKQKRPIDDSNNSDLHPWIDGLPFPPHKVKMFWSFKLVAISLCHVVPLPLSTPVMVTNWPIWHSSPSRLTQHPLHHRFTEWSKWGYLFFCFPITPASTTGPLTTHNPLLSPISPSRRCVSLNIVDLSHSNYAHKTFTKEFPMESLIQVLPL